MNKLLSIATQNIDAQVARAEKDLGMPLRGDGFIPDRRLMTPREVALETCRMAPEIVAGPFHGFKKVLARGAQTEADKRAFLATAAKLHNFMLLMPTPDGKIMRTLVTLHGGKTVRLSVFGAETRFGVSDTERMILSGVAGYNNGHIGSHGTGSPANEPGHVALVNGVMLGGYKSTNIHRDLHNTFEGKDKNILATTAASAQTSQLGVAIPSKEYEYETWPSSLMLVWHSEDGTPEAAVAEGAVTKVQAVGFLAVRENNKLPELVRLLGSFA